jgi:hypothetical protein
MRCRSVPRLPLLLLGTLLLGILCVVGATRECRDDLQEADGYTIRSVTVEGRWMPPLSLLIKPGDRFSNAKIQAAMEAVRQAIRSDRNQTFELQNMNSVGVLHVTRCLLVEGRSVDVVIQPRYLRVDLVRVGSNILPIPRSFLPTFYQSVPRPLLAFNPALGAYQDKHYGFASTFGIASNLLNLPGTLNGEPPAAQDTQVQLAASGRKSVEHSFYEADANLTLAKQRLGEFIENFALEIDYQGKDEPESDQTFSRQAAQLGVSLRLKPAAGAIRTISVGGKYRLSDNRLSGDNQFADGFENAAEGRVIAEGRTGGGFFRAGIWADAASPHGGGVYERVAALFGFEREILVAQNQTIGIETVLGGGRAWGTPQYARFYGGNSDRNFLYDSLDSPALNSFPTGPWIRSFGEGQAVAGSSGNSQGATSYWHINLNVSLPIPSLSRPLIPNEVVTDGVTLNQLLKNKAGDSVSFYAVQLQSEGLSRTEALAKAQAVYGEVKPAVEFIADRANIYSIKPLILCDVAGLEAPGVGYSTRVALGGGIQFTIVIAKLELGYMHTIAGEPGDRSGNLFARLVFQNLF